MSGPDLALLRKRLRLSQAGLADLLGVHEQTISKWERETLRGPGAPVGDERVQPWLATLARFADYRSTASAEPPISWVQSQRGVVAAWAVILRAVYP